MTNGLGSIIEKWSMGNGPARIKRYSLPWIALFILAFAPTRRATEFYYLMVFGSQQIPPRAKYSHSFAVFVRATGQGACAENYALEYYTISWVPQTLDIRLLALSPECGQNLELHATIHWALSTEQRISMWGPYLVNGDRYWRAAQQVQLLQSGQVGYKALDSGFPTDVATNCIHAVSSVVDGHRLRVLSPGFGETASFFITRRLQPWILDDEHKHDWIAARLGLDRYPMVRRELENPRSGLFR